MTDHSVHELLARVEEHTRITLGITDWYPSAIVNDLCRPPTMNVCAILCGCGVIGRSPPRACRLSLTQHASRTAVPTSSCPNWRQSASVLSNMKTLLEAGEPMPQGH